MHLLNTMLTTLLEVHINATALNPLSISSGAKAIIYFYIKKTFAGKLIIPETKMAKLYGTISRDTRLITHNRWRMFIFVAISLHRKVVK